MAHPKADHPGNSTPTKPAERKPLLVPPKLRTGEDREANRLELFFDLAYVMVLAELATAFGKDLTWSGLTDFLGLFVMIWFSWVGFTLYANRFDTDDVAFRLAKITATLAIAGCAASASKATGDLALEFSVAYLAGRIVLTGLYLRAWIHVPDARRTIAVYTTGAAVTSALIAISVIAEPHQRPWWWAAAIAIDALTPLIASKGVARSAPVHMEHLPERLGLFIILVLGEGVLGAVTAVSDANWKAPSLLGGIFAFTVIAACWWSYFDAGAQQAATGLENHEEERNGTGEAHDPGHRHDVYLYAHLAMAAGLALTAVGLKDLALHPAQTVGANAWLASGGLATFCLGLLTLLLSAGTEWRRSWWPLAGVAAFSVVALVVDRAVWFAGATALVSVGLAVLATTVKRTTSL